jgi:G:T-mismatch repair DNA endonuclease (very short patch repair protein)
VDGFCAETETVYEFNGCYWHGHTCQSFRDIPTVAGETLAQRYEKTVARLAQFKQAGYKA